MRLSKSTKMIRLVTGGCSMKFSVFIFSGFLSFTTGFSQSNVKLLSSDSMKVFRKDGISVWGNFYNAGNTASGGSLILEEGVNMVMYGDTFKNVNASQVGGGGEIIMTRPRPFPYATNGLQVFDGGGLLSSIPDLTINSPDDVELKINDLKVRDSLKFIQGHLILNKYDLVLGNGNPGTITGYNQDRYIITNGNTLDTAKGFFIREQIDNQNYVFPVGQSASDYTPAVLKNSGTADNFKVRVFDTVYEEGYYQFLYNSLSVPADERSVKRTWDVRESVKGGSNINMTLQYNTATEGSFFAYNRNHAFITHYVGYFPNFEGDTLAAWKWDNFRLSSTSAPVSPGTVTTGSPITAAAMKTRNGITSFSPFTITTWEVAATILPIDLLVFNAAWKSEKEAEILWTIEQKDEIINYTILKSTNGKDFTELKTLASNKKQGVISYVVTDMAVNNTGTEHYYYKLRIMDTKGNYTYSPVRMLKKQQTRIADLNIFPNPNNGKFLLILPEAGIENRIRVVDAMGRIIYETTAEAGNSNAYLKLSQISEGTYFIQVENELGKRTAKFLLVKE